MVVGAIWLGATVSNVRGAALRMGGYIISHAAPDCRTIMYFLRVHVILLHVISLPLLCRKYQQTWENSRGT